MNDTPLQVINSVAPIRICDIGGWTDTWFAKNGKVLNIAVYPYAEVQIYVFERKAREHRVTIRAENYGLHYALEPLGSGFKHLPLIEAAVHRMTIPEHLAIEVAIHCEAPPGASTGTSAAVAIATIAGLDRLTPNMLTSYEISRTAHTIETEDLGLQAGVQDQLCSAYGGINFIDINNYPNASVSTLDLPKSLWWELESRLMLVFVGKPHSSSDVHKQVIQRLESRNGEDPTLERLSELAIEGKNSLLNQDLVAFGEVMKENTACQKQLHPALISDSHQRVIDMGQKYDAAGWKVNGAGGDGGSVSILCNGLAHESRELAANLRKDGFQVIPIYLARQGLRVWQG